MSGLIKNFKKYDLDIKGVRLPSFDIESDDKEYVGIKEDCSNLEFLTALCEKGLENLDHTPSKEEMAEYKKRLKYELKILNELSFVDYILLVWDVINYCNKEGIATGLGRGSAAGSFVLYLIGVTKVNPISNKLIFERFVSKTRAKKKVVDGITYLDGGLMADIDLDICYYNRQKVLKYLEDKFQGKTSKIATLNTLTGKLVMKECSKIIAGKDEAEANRVSSMIPKKYGEVKDIYEAYEEVEEFKKWCDENPDVFKIACKLRGLIKNKSVHPSAILLSHDDLDYTCPTELQKAVGGTESIVSSYDADWVSMSNVKLDILGLKGVSVVDQTLKHIEKTQGKKIGQREILRDLATHDNLWRHLEDLRQRHGLFHIEADTAYKVCRQVKPENIDELSAVLALARPGAIDFTEQYANAKDDKVTAEVHPFFQEFLDDTGGVVLYQEQLMWMAHKMGFTLDEAELLRRIVGKKKVNEVKKWQKKVRRLVDKNEELQERNKEGQAAGEVFWKVLEDSANYSFNKSHSISYASVSAVTVFLKFNYPQEFFLSLLQMAKNEPDAMNEISKIQKELDWFDIKLLPPHILKSEEDFSIEGDNLRFGLSSIRGVSANTMEKIDNFRHDDCGKSRDGYKTLNKFEVFLTAKEAGINIGVLSALIQAGALEGFGISRTLLVYEAQLWNLLTDREKRYIFENDFKFAKKYNFNLVKIVKALDEVKVLTAKGKLTRLIRETRLKTLRTKAAPYKEIFDMNNKNKEFANWYYEKHFLGYAYHTTLQSLFNYRDNIRDVDGALIDEKVTFVGWVDDVTKGKSRNGNAYLRLELSDEKAEMRTMIFSKRMDACQENNGRLPAKSDIVVVKGTKKDQAVFADSIEIADVTIYTKLSELKG